MTEIVEATFFNYSSPVSCAWFNQVVSKESYQEQLFICVIFHITEKVVLILTTCIKQYASVQAAFVSALPHV